MDLSSFQQVDAVEVVDVAPLNYSGNIGGNAQFDIDTWNWCITSQFPISRVEKDNNTVVLHIGSPHQSYTIRTRMKNNTLDGPAVILTPSNRVIAEFNYVNGEIEGKCKLYYESGSVFFVGHLEHGYRQGNGIEYDETGNVIYQGIFEKGCRNILYEPSEELDGYWKVFDNKGEMKALVHRDSQGNTEGTCYSYSSGQVERVSRWSDNREVELLYELKDDIMIEYRNGVKCFEGTYYGDYDSGYYRISGTEFDSQGNVVYVGDYYKNKRCGLGTSIKNNRIQYEGEWAHGFSIATFKFLFIVLPYMLSVVLIAISFFIFNPFIAVFVVLGFVIADIIYACVTKKYVVSSPYTREFDVPMNAKPVIQENRTILFPEMSFNQVTTCSMYGFKTMEHLQFLSSSFNERRYQIGSRNEAFCQIANCSSLQTIQMSPFSFADYSKGLYLSNLNALESITIGSLSEESDNFLHASLTLRGLQFSNIFFE